MRCAALCLFLAAALAAAPPAPGADEAPPDAPPDASPGRTEAAVAAARQLEDAIVALGEANGGKDRIAALTRTIGAYEDGLALFRESLRRAALSEDRIRADWDARRGEIGAVLAALTALQDVPLPLLVAHPDGPEAAVRSGLILASVAPALQDRAAELGRDLAIVRALREERAASAGLLQRGLVAAQEARAALAQAMQDRTGLPERFIDDPEELQLLVAAVKTLDAFAEGIAAQESDIGPPGRDFAGARGSLPMPVRGTVLRLAGEADAAGIRRPGLVIATRPAALVTAPWPATIRYRGPLLDYGNVMVLEPAGGYLMILAGLGTVFGETGDVIAAGAPVGLMPGAEAEDAAVLMPSEGQRTGAAGAGQSETLYLELREGTDPVDPSEWFAVAEND
ncbi:MAG: murein hydrolase activator EnvC family protein [Paracoccaceae bacterium]